MTEYVKSTNFASKDSLATGNPLKIVKGTEIDTEFNNIATAVATKADLNSPTFIGTPTAPTASVGTNTTQIATTAFVGTTVTNERTATVTLTNKTLTSPVIETPSISSPSLTGVPTAPTAAVNTNTTQVATTAFVVSQIADDAPAKNGTGATGTWSINISGNAATVSTPSVAAGTKYQNPNLDTTSATNSSYSLLSTQSLRIYAAGTIRVVWEMASGGPPYIAYGRIYKNGVAVGTARSTNSPFSTQYTDDISVSSGDVIELYGYTTGGPESPIYAKIAAVGTASDTPWPIIIRNTI